MTLNGRPVSIVMIEDDEGHARLIEKNIRRAGVNNEIVPFQTGGAGLSYLFGVDGSGEVSSGRSLLILLDQPSGHGRRRNSETIESERSHSVFPGCRLDDNR